MAVPKYMVEVKKAEKPIRTRKEAVEAVKDAIGSKMMRKMKREYVDCPVAGKQVPFLECFACISFIRRIKGVVHCAGREFRLKA